MTAEHVRLEEARRAEGSLEEVGTVPQRAAVGNRPRGLQRGRRRLELLQPRSGPLARLSLGRGRPGRHLRRPAAALLRAGPVERQGPDPQGAPVRPDQQREQSRRGRQGVLLLPRQHADALVHEVPLQVSAGGVSVRRPRRDQPRPQPQRVRVRAARHRRLRRGSLLRRVRRVRQGVARGHPDPDHRPQPRPGSGRAARPADALVPQSVVLARQARPADACSRSPATRRRASSRRSMPMLGERYLYCEGDAPLLFTENETNTQRIFGVPNRSPYVKDSINDYVVHGQQEAVNPEKKGTKAAAHYRLTVKPGECQVVRLRLSDVAPARVRRRQRQAAGPFGSQFDDVLAGPAQGGRRVLRGRHPAVARRRRRPTSCARPWRACSGASSSTTTTWTSGSKSAAPIRSRRRARRRPRNDHWHHMYNGDVISMPDKWEYPWYAAWDLAFHVLALTLVDPDFGKQQLKLMLRERYMHPNGQIPAYEWNFGDVNPPVHAWSTIFTYRLEKAQTGRGRQGVAQEQLPEAAPQLHLVGQPQGPLRAERLRGRLPGAGQHRRLRSQRAAADRRLSGAGRRHRLDGAVLPEHAGNRRGAGA